MHSKFVLTSAAILLGLLALANADCCYYTYNCKEIDGKKTTRCDDCYEPSHYCGVGSCNVFGCNCDGGCRKGNASLWCWNPAYCTRRSAQFSDVVQMVSLADFDSNNALDKKEFEALFELKGFAGDKETEFKRLDLNADGLVTLAEIDPDH